MHRMIEYRNSKINVVFEMQKVMVNCKSFIIGCNPIECILYTVVCGGFSSSSSYKYFKQNRLHPTIQDEETLPVVVVRFYITNKFSERKIKVLI